jgi:hypothetical protein
VRNWLTPRCVLIVLLLVAAPGAALAHLLVTWAPGQLELARLDREVARHAQQLDAELEQGIKLQQRTARLQELAAATAARAHWLPRRDQHEVFDRIAEALCDGQITIEQLALGEPSIYAAASRANLLACERVTALCTGDYGALTACLDRIENLDLPLRFEKLSWHRAGGQLALTLQFQVPFVPDETLREVLAKRAKLPEQDHEP